MKSLVRKIILESLLSEDEKHIRQLFTNWANKKSKNPELAMSLMDDFLMLQFGEILMEEIGLFADEFLE
jgi:hypothetical protein